MHGAGGDEEGRGHRGDESCGRRVLVEREEERRGGADEEKEGKGRGERGRPRDMWERVDSYGYVRGGGSSV